MRVAGEDKTEIIHDECGYIAVMYAQEGATSSAQINFGVDTIL